MKLALETVTIFIVCASYKESILLFIEDILRNLTMSVAMLWYNRSYLTWVTKWVEFFHFKFHKIAFQQIFHAAAFQWRNATLPWFKLRRTQPLNNICSLRTRCNEIAKYLIFVHKMNPPRIINLKRKLSLAIWWFKDLRRPQLINIICSRHS